MKTGKWLLVLFLPISLSTYGSITFQVETLSKPTNTLPVKNEKEVFHQILTNSKGNLYIEDNIVSHNKFSKLLVTFGAHSFFEGMHKAYADHRPFTLSPDMVWILISQGFSHHVNNNAETLRYKLVKHQGKMNLEVVTTTIKLDNPNSPWETIFPKFTNQINKYVENDLVNTLTCNFSTTKPTDIIASQITIMETMQSYFEYFLTSISCGIPQVTLEGTPEDWQKIIDKTKSLARYDLAWWTDSMIPTLEEIKKTSEGKVDTTFWQSMFIRPNDNGFGTCGPTDIDGWIVSFFPYNKNGNRNDLIKISGASSLPMELSCVDVNYKELNSKGNIVRKEVLELWSGFVGLSQNPETFALKPEIGWMIRKKGPNDKAILQAIDKGIQKGADYFKFGIDSLTKEMLAKLIDYQKKTNKTFSMEINFSSKIIFPNNFNQIKLKFLYLNGIIDQNGIENLRKKIKNAGGLIINGRHFDVF